jgi:DNA-binding NarL/FixJ family response regulator
MDRCISLVVIDDHDVARKGLEAWCQECDPPIEVVGSGDTVETAFRGTAPQADVVVLDLQLAPGRPRLEGLQRLVDADRRVVVYTQFAEHSTAVRCIELGALAYVTKAEAGDHLIAAIRAAADGRPYTPPTLGGAIAGNDDPQRPALSIQEITALRAWFASRSKDMAARSMGIAPATIHTYIERARTKYAAHGRPASTKSDMVRRALEDGLVELSELDSAPPGLR